MALLLHKKANGTINPIYDKHALHFTRICTNTIELVNHGLLLNVQCTSFASSFARNSLHFR